MDPLLAGAGLPLHTEPRVLEPLQSRASLCSFPYSFIHYLRRAYAYRVDAQDWVAEPLKEDEDPTEDDVHSADSDPSLSWRLFQWLKI